MFITQYQLLVIFCFRCNDLFNAKRIIVHMYIWITHSISAISILIQNTRIVSQINMSSFLGLTVSTKMGHFLHV